jgi:hypothetical protein
MSGKRGPSSSIPGGCVLRENCVALLVRTNIESENPLSWAVVVDGSNRYEFRLVEDYFVGIVARQDNFFALGKGGNVCRFAVPPDASRDEIENSRREWLIPDANDFGALNRIRVIGDEVYCCGQFAQVYRYENDTWIRGDDGFRSFDGPDFEDIGGKGQNDLYGVGLFGTMHRYDGERWQKVDVPTDQHLLCIKHSTDEDLYIGGYNGLVMRGHLDRWRIIAEPVREKRYWDLERFADRTYFAFGGGIDSVKDDVAEAVELKIPKKLSFHRLSAKGGQLWSFGLNDVLKFDGVKWELVRIP